MAVIEQTYSFIVLKRFRNDTGKINSGLGELTESDRKEAKEMNHISGPEDAVRVKYMKGGINLYYSPKKHSLITTANGARAHFFFKKKYVCGHVVIAGFLILWHLFHNKNFKNFL